VNKVIVSNTGPIIGLALIGRLELLQKLYGTVIIPTEVRTELSASPKKARRFTIPPWITVKKIRSIPDPLLSVVLDSGEAAVISLARHIRADGVLIDERKGRKVAHTVYGINVVGTAGILIQAKRAGLIENVSDLLNEMKRMGYWIHNKIIEAAAKSVGEIK
jgi:predicted nucleic acid-binding protein